MSREDEIRDRLESADPKDWRHHDFGFPSDEEPTSIAIHEGKFDWRAISEGEFIAMLPDADAPDDRNARLIANAPADLAYLLAENARLRAQLDTVRELHRKVPGYMLADECDCEGDPKDASHFEDAWSGELLCGTSPTGDYYCANCTYSDDEPQPWPCDTAAALNQGGETNGE